MPNMSSLHGVCCLVSIAACLTCILPKLVHGLEVYYVGREPAVHLAEDHAPSAGVAAPNGRLYLVRDGRAVWPPSAVFVQPFPHNHGRGLEHVVTVGPGREKGRGITGLLAGSSAIA